jgi:hypothetical protein
MYELPALEFIGAAIEIRRLITTLDQDQGTFPDAGPFDHEGSRQRMAGIVSIMATHLQTIGNTLAWIAADRLQKNLLDPEYALTFGQVKQQLRDIESRFADHLSLVKLFVARSEQLPLLGSAADLLGVETAERFTTIWFDCEEAAKCIVVLRPTAAVFHCMRMLEIGIKAFAARLGIDDPVKPAQRNWGAFLREIKTKIDATYSADKRMPGSEGAFMESLYATLDAVKNPWRNETMHVEGVYTDSEARFILINTVNFIQKMASGFDENGADVDPPLALPGGGNGS